MKQDQDTSGLVKQLEELRKMNEQAQLEMGDRVIALLDSVGLGDLVRARLSSGNNTPQYDDGGRLLCSHFGCDRPVRANGLCQAHEKRKRRKADMYKPVSERRHGDVSKPLRKYEKHAKCSVDGCDKRVKAKGLCGAHYERSRAGVDPNKPVRKYTHRDTRESSSAPIGHPVQLSKTIADVGMHHKEDCPAFSNCSEYASLKGWGQLSCNACDGPGKKGKGKKGIRLK